MQSERWTNHELFPKAKSNCQILELSDYFMTNQNPSRSYMQHMDPHTSTIIILLRPIQGQPGFPSPIRPSSFLYLWVAHMGKPVKYIVWKTDQTTRSKLTRFPVMPFIGTKQFFWKKASIYCCSSPSQRSSGETSHSLPLSSQQLFLEKKNGKKGVSNGHSSLHCSSLSCFLLIIPSSSITRVLRR